jgi:hypothetical protein
VRAKSELAAHGLEEGCSLGVVGAAIVKVTGTCNLTEIVAYATTGGVPLAMVLVSVVKSIAGEKPLP